MGVPRPGCEARRALRARELPTGRRRALSGETGSSGRRGPPAGTVSQTAPALPVSDTWPGGRQGLPGQQRGGCGGSGGRPPAPLGSGHWAPLGAGCRPGCWGGNADTPCSGSEPCPQPGQPCPGRLAGTRGLSLPGPGGGRAGLSVTSSQPGAPCRRGVCGQPRKLRWPRGRGARVPEGSGCQA